MISVHEKCVSNNYSDCVSNFAGHKLERKSLFLVFNLLLFLIQFNTHNICVTFLKVRYQNMAWGWNNKEEEKEEAESGSVADVSAKIQALLENARNKFHDEYKDVKLRYD